MVNLIVAMAEESRVIGLDGDMPWKLGADLRRFKKLTTGHTVVMGRKTWESIPEKFRPLPNRRNVVLSRQQGYIKKLPHGVGLCTSLEDAVTTHRHLVDSPVDAKWGDLFIIGGESLYREAYPITDRIYLTLVRYDGKGDTFFPDDPWTRFEEDPEFEQEAVSADKKNTHAFLSRIHI